jgi:phosphoglycerate dehydrogenase-like enzyme
MWYKIAQNKPNVLLIEWKTGTNKKKGLWEITNEDLEPLKKICNLSYVRTDSMTETQLAEKCSDYDYLMLNMDFLPAYPDKMEKLTEKFYNHKGIKNLKGINVDMTDADFFSPEECQKRNIILQTCPNAVSQSVAESTITEILLHSRQRHLAYNDQINKEDVECRKGINLEGKTAGIIGYGNIGKTVANILRGFGMNVLVNDINTNLGVEITPLKTIFKNADVISIHIPALENNSSNKSNVGLIDKSLLNLCKDTILINLATDIIVDTEGLVNAIKTNKIRGYSVEPGRAISKELEKYPQVHISPCSYDSDESRKNVRTIWINNMISAIKGHPENVWAGSLK